MEASSSRNLDPAGNYTTTIPFDLTFDILSRLPAKSLIRFQSVSKLWLSIIRSKYFVDSFFTRSKTRPRLLFNFKFKHLDIPKQFIFSAPEHVPKDNKTSLVMARHDMTISGFVYNIRYRPVNGFVCCKRGSSIAVCNPTTRQLVKLPDVEANGRDIHVRLGYDPVEDQFKVLCVLLSHAYKRKVYRPNFEKPEHFVFTLSSQQKEWRKIETNEQVTYRRVRGGICIDGAIYYGVGNQRIFRFDVRTEKIEFIQVPKESYITRRFCSTLINYNGKLGGVGYFSEGVGLWLLEDVVENKWSNIYTLASGLRELLGDCVFSGEIIHTGELMECKSSRLRSSKSSSVFFYKRDSIRKVEVQGIADYDFRRVYGIDKLTNNPWMFKFPGYVENIRFL